jgi:hypothetical protein
MSDQTATLLDQEEEITLDLSEPSEGAKDEKGQEPPAKQEEKTEDKGERSGGPDDYGLGDGNPPKKEEGSDDEKTFKQRYSDSSTEAKNLRAKLNELAEIIEGDPELFDKFKEKAGERSKHLSTKKDDDPTVTKLQAKVEELEQIVTRGQSANHGEVISSFESKVKEQTGRVITPDMRAAMKPTVQQLTKANVPLEKALRMAWFDTYGDSIAADAAKAGENRALVKSKEAADATETSRTSGGKPPKKGATITLTVEEVKQARRMGVNTQEELKRFAKKLYEVRQSKE